MFITRDNSSDSWLICSSYDQLNGVRSGAKSHNSLYYLRQKRDRAPIGKLARILLTAICASEDYDV